MPIKISYSQYRAYATKGTPQVYFDKFYRWASHPITFLGIRLGFTPNFFTAFSVFFTVFGGVLIISGHVEQGLLVMILGYVFDFCDGNAARFFIKTGYLSKIYQLRGCLLESVNTNIYIPILYGSLGWYFFVQYNEPLLLVFAFSIVIIKIISRYTVRHAYELFREFMTLVQPGREMMKKYSGSVSAKIKFFVTKSFFSPNFSLAVMIFAFFLAPNYFLWVFITYGTADGLVSVARMARSIFKRYDL